MKTKSYYLKWGITFAVIMLVLNIGENYFRPEMSSMTQPILAGSQSIVSQFMLSWIGLCTYVILLPIGIFINILLRILVPINYFYSLPLIYVVISASINGIFLGWLYSKFKRHGTAIN